MKKEGHESIKVPYIPRSTPAWLCTSCCHFNGCFRFLLCLPSVCSVASYIRYLTNWLLCRTPFILITFLNMAFCENPGLHTCFGFNFNRGLNNTDGFASNRLFPQRAVLHKNRVIHKHNVLHKNNVLAGPVQGLFAACRLALSMVAGGTRRRRLNISINIYIYCIHS